MGEDCMDLVETQIVRHCIRQSICWFWRFYHELSEVFDRTLLYLAKSQSARQNHMTIPWKDECNPVYSNLLCAISVKMLFRILRTCVKWIVWNVSVNFCVGILEFGSIQRSRVWLQEASNPTSFALITSLVISIPWAILPAVRLAIRRFNSIYSCVLILLGGIPLYLASKFSISIMAQISSQMSSATSDDAISFGFRKYESMR